MAQIIGLLMAVIWSKTCGEHVLVILAPRIVQRYNAMMVMVWLLTARVHIVLLKLVVAMPQVTLVQV